MKKFISSNVQRLKTISKVTGTIGTGALLYEKYQEGYKREPSALSDLVPGASLAKKVGMFHITHNEEQQRLGRLAQWDRWNELTKDDPRLPPWEKD